jgi:deoxyribonuclease-4
VPVFVHAPYLINFGSPSPETLAKSAAALRFSLQRAADVGARGVVLHAGSAVLGNRWDEAMVTVRDSILRALDSVPDGPRLLVEPTAGGGGSLASDAPSTAGYVAEFDGDERIGLCLDTCHLHAAGHDVADSAGLLKTLRAYRAAGPIELLHVNDSRDPVGSKRDRHESLGRGTIGSDAFAALFRSPATRHVPMIVETADADHEGDIETLKKLRSVVAGR